MSEVIEFELAPEAEQVEQATPVLAEGWVSTKDNGYPKVDGWYFVSDGSWVTVRFWDIDKEQWHSESDLPWPASNFTHYQLITLPSLQAPKIPTYQHYLEHLPQYELVGYPQSHDDLPLLVILRHKKTGKLHVTTMTNLRDGTTASGEKRWKVAP